MTRFPAVDCALEGFRLTRERPRDVAVWGALLLLSAIVTAAISVGSGLQPALLALQAASQTGDAVAVNARFGAVAARAPALALILAIGISTNVVVYTALLRAILRPDAQGRSFYLRIGADEARQLGVSALVALLLFVATVLAATVAALLMATVPGAGASANAISGAVIVGGLLFPIVRLTLASPLAFDTRQIAIREAWRLGRGQFAGMVGAYVLALVMALLVYLLVMIVVGALLLAGLEIAGLGLGDLGAWLRLDASSLAAFFSLHSLVAILLQGVLTTLFFALIMSPAPAIYRALRAAPGAVSPAT